MSNVDISVYNNAWLGLGDLSKLKINNELMHDVSLETLGLDALRFLRKPENFTLTCKVLFNIDVLPIQAAILEELWNRPFPMYIASRGFGKAILDETNVYTSDGWKKIKDLTLTDKVYGRDGLLAGVTGIYPQGKKQICRITMLDGRTIDCCEDHLWVVKYQTKERIITTKEMFDSGISYSATKSGGRVYKYKIPNCEPLRLKKHDLPIDPYILGCLLGDGYMGGSTPRISTDDSFIVDEFIARLPGFILNRDNTTNNYNIIDTNKDATIYVSTKGHEYVKQSNNRLTSKIRELRLNVGCKDKFIPDIYKFSCIEDRFEIIRGLLDTDGSINKNGSIEFTNTCEKLVDDLIDILRSLGITCVKKIDDRSGQYMTMPQGTEMERRPYFRVFIHTSQPVFKLPRKVCRLKANTTSEEHYVSITNIEYINEYANMTCITVDNEDHTYITKDYIVTHNSFILALYAMLRLILIPETKIVIVGAAFRQAKVIFEYMETIWRNADIARSICGEGGPRRDVDRCTMRFNGSWAIAIPLGNGDKIRGLRAHTIISDEFSSIPPDIYETVVAGFAAVSAEPIANVKEAARRQAMVNAGIWTADAEQKYKAKGGNQAIISGTAGYGFEHFADYWKRYRNIINSQGDSKKLKELFELDEMPENFNWKDYSIIRIPYELVPQGFMDDRQIMRAKATVHSAIYAMEYGAVFSDDSDGFFKRSLIESCVASYKNVQKSSWPKWCPDEFDAKVHGSTAHEYVFGVDPASENDNFSIIVLELHDEHTRIVYSWTTTRKDFKERLKAGLVKDHNFYSFCARKIRDLMKVFPCKAIAMDAQGGGIAVEEALHDPEKLLPGEVPIWPVIDDEKEKDTDVQPGLHILHLCQFAKADWTSEANHGLRKDLEDHILLFPRFDPITIELSIEEDKRRKTLFEEANPSQKFNIYDTLEDCIMEIEELKDELSTIKITKTGTGVNSRDRWDTPEIKLPNGKKGRMRKDRYSALVMANMVARTMHRMPTLPDYAVIGGAVGSIAPSDKGQLYMGPTWFTDAMVGDVVCGVSRQYNI